MTAEPHSPLGPSAPRLSGLREGESAVLAGLELPAFEAIRLMELGFIPGTRVTALRSAPGGDPRVFLVDGSSIALRRETVERITVEAAR